MVTDGRWARRQLKLEWMERGDGYEPDDGELAEDRSYDQAPSDDNDDFEIIWPSAMDVCGDIGLGTDEGVEASAVAAAHERYLAEQFTDKE